MTFENVNKSCNFTTFLNLFLISVNFVASNSQYWPNSLVSFLSHVFRVEMSGRIRKVMECEHVLVSRSLVVVGGSCLGDNKKGQMDHLSRTLGHYPVSGFGAKTAN